MEEKLLVKKAKFGDTEAFANLYEKVYKKMYQFALYTLRSEDDAEDVVSETVMDAFVSIKSLKKDELFSAWIFQILSNKCKKKMKEYYKKECSIEETYDNVKEKNENIGHEDKLSIEDKMDLCKVFSELSPEERLIVGMHIFFGYKTREIAKVMKLNDSTVRSKESRALKKMAAKIGKEG